MPERRTTDLTYESCDIDSELMTHASFLEIDAEVIEQLHSAAATEARNRIGDYRTHYIAPLASSHGTYWNTDSSLVGTYWNTSINYQYVPSTPKKIMPKDIKHLPKYILYFPNKNTTKPADVVMFKIGYVKIPSNYRFIKASTVECTNNFLGTYYDYDTFSNMSPERKFETNDIEQALEVYNSYE